MRAKGISGSALLLLIRDEIATDWRSLCKELGLEPNVQRTDHIALSMQLRSLRDAGLISFEGEVDETIRGDIKVTPVWQEMQAALDVSLYALADLRPAGRLIVSPFFGSTPGKPKNETEVFVAMPFSDDLQPIYEDHIRAVCQDLGLSVARADDFFSTGSVVYEVWRALNASKVVVADCTGRNPNVFYEIGIAHTLGKPVIIVTQDRGDAPFDIRYIYNIEYEFTPRGMATFERRLTESLRRVLAAEDVS